MRSSGLMPVAALLALVSCGCGASAPGDHAAAASADPNAEARAPAFGDAFWSYWGDGHAEISTYDQTFPRYGQRREGVAVAIFVTETFSNSARVKSDPGNHPESDEFQVMKLNLVEDFPTGIYDYNIMTSVFVALKPVNGRPAGHATKVSFSSQDWCGQVYSQLLFDASAVRRTLHSYFDGEGDQEETIQVPAEALAADALMLWARGFMVPLLESGEKREVPIVRSLKDARIRHEPVVLERATVSRSTEATSIEVPAGVFDVDERTVDIEGGASWTFAIERAAPNRLVAWSSSTGHRGALIASERVKYWELNREGDESRLAELGLEPRGRRVP